MQNHFSGILYSASQLEKIKVKLRQLGEIKRRKKYSNNKYIRDLQERMDQEYVDMRRNPVIYLNTRYFTSFIVFILVIYITDMGYIYAPIITIIYYYLFYYFTIDLPIKKRTKKLDREALQFFEILTLTLESGRNLENALEITVANVEGEISREFNKALIEMKFGKSLLEAVEDMKMRIPSEAINNILLNITQTSVFGSDILDTMYNQIDYLRDKQILAIKEQINKIPNKISIISVVFVVPLILMLVLGPFIINYFI